MIAKWGGVLAGLALVLAALAAWREPIGTWLYHASAPIQSIGSIAAALAAFFAWRTASRSTEAAIQSAEAAKRSVEVSEQIAELENYRASRDFDPTEVTIIQIPHPCPEELVLEIDYRGEWACSIVEAEWYANAHGAHCVRGEMEEVCRGAFSDLPEVLAPQQVCVFSLAPMVARIHKELQAKSELWARAGGRVAIMVRLELSILPKRIRPRRKIFWLGTQFVPEGMLGMNTIVPERFDIGPWLRGEAKSPFDHPLNRSAASQQGVFVPQNPFNRSGA